MLSSNSKKKTDVVDFSTLTPLTELAQRIQLLETSVHTVRQRHIDSLLSLSEDGTAQQPATNSATAKPTKSLGRFFRRGNATATTEPTSRKAENDTTTDSAVTSLRVSTTPAQEVRFVEIPDVDVFVENLRRIAELVITGENFVTNLQKKEEAAFRKEQEKWKTNRDIIGEDPSEGSDHNNHNGSSRNLEDDENKDEYLQLFDHFFERNTLEFIINLLTGRTFDLTDEEKKQIQEKEAEAAAAKEEQGKEDSAAADSKSQDGTDEEEPGALPASPQKTRRRSVLDGHPKILLPPFAIATQALQSVSILIQNVSRATSLYFMLSNNRINELIQLPLDHYLAAERHRQLAASKSTSQATMTFSSPEISELTTHFVTFLKSLALRMNAQTLQFFLKYPDEVTPDGTKTASPSHFSERAEDDGDPSEFGEEEDPDGEDLFLRLKVEFPLYERALEFCGAHQDSFVRVTAMNICLNTLRLTTVSPPDEITGTDSEDASPRSFSLGSSPDGVLHNAKPLPFRERLAIAQFTCIPSRVERLISPIFTKLAERWNLLDEQIRVIDSNRDLSSADSGGDMTGSRNDKMAKAKEKVRRERLLRQFKDKAADLQDELLLLEDVFSVGLTVLNEQLIEMMLATFVYPLLLQPLLLYYQRLSAALTKPSHSFSEHPFGGYTGDFTRAERELAAVSGPAKTAMVALGSVFHFLSNKPLLSLIYTALLHPLSPDSSGVPTLRSTLEVATINDNGRKSIRLDSLDIGKGDERTTYLFGTTPGNRRVSRASVDLSAVKVGGEACVFVLSPALAEVLEFRGEDMALIARTRPNPYRRALLQCLDVPADISDVRELAMGTLDAALSALDSQFASEILLGVDLKSFNDDMPLDERNLDSIHAHLEDDRGIGGGASHQSRTSLDPSGRPVSSDPISEVVPVLCRCVVTAAKHPSSTFEWKLVYDEVAGHALLSSIRGSTKAMSSAAQAMEQRWRQAASFIAAMPMNIQSPMGGSDIPMHGAPSVNAPDYEEQIQGVMMNHIFFDTIEAGDTSPAIEHLVQLADVVNAGTRDSLISVSFQSAFDSICSRVGKFLLEGVEADALQLSDKGEVQLAREDCMVLLKVDALTTLLKDLASTNGGLLNQTDLAGVALSSDGSLTSLKDCFDRNVLKQVFSPVSSRVNAALLGENDIKEKIPEPSSLIDMSGKALLPCVCEAPAHLASLFSDETTGVVSEGVTWQSLYVVLLEDVLVLVQPRPGALGSSYGRVITGCYLERLTVKRDGVVDPNGPPARRLFLSHHWFGTIPPALFLFDAVPEPEKVGPLNRTKPFTSTVDVWFEDQSGADRAYEILVSKIFSAKARRGRRMEEFLASKTLA